MESTENTNYLTRVAQVDALKLDNEIVEIFKKQIFEVMKYMPANVVTKFDPEITLLLRLFMFNYSLVKNNASFGQQLLAIKYDNLSNKKLILYGVLTHGLNYMKDRSHTIRSDYLDGFNLTKLIDRLEGLVFLANVVNFLNFIRTGEKPLLIDRILNLKQISTTKRYISSSMYAFLSREILWHTFIELLVIILPLVNYHRIIRQFKNLNPFGKQIDENRIESTRSYTLTTRCANCNERPINPHHMGCSHIFCYYCLKGNLDADIDFQCPICNFAGRKCIKFYI